LCSISNYQLLSNRYPWIHQQWTPHTESLLVPIPMLTCWLVSPHCAAAELL
jgi:hypothetical protein